jgi:hypothetical protein
MKLLNRHNWRQRGFRDYVCKDCGAERIWDSELQRYRYWKHGKGYYFTPDCKLLIHCDAN